MRSLFVISVSALALSACATKPLPPAISYDSDDFKPAVIDRKPAKPVEIVEVPKVLPLPGQLQPEPGEVTEDKRPPTQRVEDANKAATQEPTKYGYVNAIQVYPYTEGALYRLYAAPERVSDIALQPGEKLTSVSAGDTVRWVIGDTVSGTDDSERTHVLVKPFAPGLKTNLVITTDRRAYHLQLESTERTAMAAVSWTYPTDQITALRRQNTAAEAALPVASNVALENIRFRYAITGDKLPDRTPAKITVTVGAELNQALRDYATLYRATYGEAESVAELIPFMLEAFLDSDRAFAKARKEGLPDTDTDKPARRTRSARAGDPAAASPAVSSLSQFQE